MLKLTSGWLAILALFMLTLSSCDDDDDGGVTGPQTLAEIAAGDDRFDTLSELLEMTGLDVTLDGAGPFTVFAPTDDAFDDVDLSGLSNDEARQLLLYHVLSGRSLTAAEIDAGQTFVGTGSTAGPNGSQLTLLVDKDGAAVTLNGDASVIQADVTGSNGVIHVIDEVLEYQSIVDFATKTDALSSLAGALTDANLVDALTADGPFTVFAPTNQAFADAAGTIATLSAAQVAEVLTYHVIAGANVRAEQVTDGPAATLAGQSLNLMTTADGDVIIMDAAGNSVPVDLENVQGINGVVHVIESVLIPNL